MNLEQIKEAQQNLNHQLLKVLEELRVVVKFIAGEDINNLALGEQDSASAPINGILDSIAYSQQENNNLINLLNNQVGKLADSTFQRDQIVVQDMHAGKVVNN